MMKLYRLARWLYLHNIPLLPWILKGLNRVLFGVVLPYTAQIGRDVLLSYQGIGTVIHRNAVIGDKVTIASGVTIGGRSGNLTVPVIGEGTFVGTGAKVLGPVRVGRYVSIGANAVVLKDVPDFAVVVGIPARVVRINSPADLPDYRAFQQEDR